MNAFPGIGWQTEYDKLASRSATRQSSKSIADPPNKPN
jgi:hypothetical protein